MRGRRLQKQQKALVCPFIALCIPGVRFFVKVETVGVKVYVRWPSSQLRRCVALRCVACAALSALHYVRCDAFFALRAFRCAACAALRTLRYVRCVSCLIWKADLTVVSKHFKFVKTRKILLKRQS